MSCKPSGFVEHKVVSTFCVPQALPTKLGVHQKSKPCWQVAVVACMPQSRSGVKAETLAFSMNWCSCGLESTTTHYHYHHYSLLHHHHYDLYYLLSTAITQGATTTANTTNTANATSNRTNTITSIIITIPSICISITTGYFCYYHCICICWCCRSALALEGQGVHPCL